jgi:hypothetical protein
MSGQSRWNGTRGIRARSRRLRLARAAVGIRRALGAVCVALASLAGAGLGRAQEASEAELARDAQNPVADLISVPLQSNFNFGVGPRNDLQYVLNLQPVVPFHLTGSWNLVTRTILPLIDQPALAPGGARVFGLGDLQPSLFLSPAKPRGVLWGVGPALSFPAATDDALGTGKLSLGPTAVVVAIQGPWVLGALASNLWSVAGDSERRAVNQLMVQPFANYNLPGGWYLAASPVITADWEADEGDRWTVPLGGGAGKVLRIGKLPVNAALQAFYSVVRPDNAADWSLRFQVQFLFPK